MVDPTKVNVIKPKKDDSSVIDKPIQTIQPRPVVMPASSSKDTVASQKVEKKPEFKNIINSADFAAKITNKVNQAVKEENINSAAKVQVTKLDEKKETPKKNDYVTDDQFFDDFFADDDD